MLYRKQGMPEEEELVLCTISSVQSHSVFAKLDEYAKQGMIHISEVAPGRIRNIRDFVVEGKKVVCKVLRIDLIKGHIDLSLRRVNESQKRKKLDEIKQEQRAEKIIESLAKKLNVELNGLYDDIAGKIFEKYEYIYQCFNDIVEDKIKIETLGIDKKTAKEVEDIVKEKIKPVEVQIRGTLTLTSYAPDGINTIKGALQKAQSADKNINVTYKGAGKYNIFIKAPDYKAAEKKMQKSISAAENFMEEKKAIFGFEREQGK